MKKLDMDSKEPKQWANINELLSKAGDHLNILEEEIDVEVQRKYMNLLTEILEDSESYKSLCKKSDYFTEKLFDETADQKTIEYSLTLLSTINDIAVYRSIEKFQQMDTPLKKWATVALQQSRMLIQSNLVDESTVYVSTGLGGHGTLLRYFCVFIAKKNVTIQPFQCDILKKEAEMVFSKSNGTIEDCGCFERFITFTILLPIEVTLLPIFESIIEECNIYGNFLRDNVIITNVKKLSPEEIDDYLNGKTSISKY